MTQGKPMKIIKAFFILLAMALAAPLLADTAGDNWSEAEVRRVDADNNRVTLRHGPIDNLQMPPMTMVFRVAQADQLADLAPGDQIHFTAEDQDGSYVVTNLKKVQDAAGEATEHEGDEHGHSH
ncbi:MAG: RND transporter [Pseudomonadaceae bacterium]|nr:MAG: RND transporter [Pseudomonadaceae bacterium]